MMRHKCYKFLLIINTVWLFSSLVGNGHMERSATGYCVLYITEVLHIINQNKDNH